MCRIVSYNIHGGIGTDKQHDYKRIGQYLTQLGADIVLLQEMDTRPSDRDTAQDINDICANNAFSLTARHSLSPMGGTAMQC